MGKKLRRGFGAVSYDRKQYRQALRIIEVCEFLESERKQKRRVRRKLK